MQPNSDLTFGGIDAAPERTTDVIDPPDWYEEGVNHYRNRVPHADNRPAFEAVLEQLTADYGVETRPVAYRDDEADEWVQIPSAAALVNPAWLGDGRADAPQHTAAWHVASRDYEPADALDAYGALLDTLRESEYETVYGTVSTYRNGGSVVIELLIDDLRFSTSDDRADEWVLGFETGYDYFGRTSIWSSLTARSTATGAAMRRLSDRFSQPHRGDNMEDNLRAYFESILSRTEQLDDVLYQVVAEAREYEIPLAELPIDLGTFVTELGFPSIYGELADKYTRKHGRPSAYDLYRAVTHILTEEFKGKKNGDALRRYASNANALLFNPASAEKRALSGHRATLIQAQDGQQTLGDEPTVGDKIDAIETRRDSLTEAVHAFEDTRAQIRTMLNDMDDETDDDHDAETTESPQTNANS